jgi:hypothetical protein
MTPYHKERDAFDEYQNRCKRNMPPLEEPKMHYVQGLDNTFKMTWEKGIGKGDVTVTWPTEEHIDSIGRDAPTTGDDMNKYQRKLTNPEGVEIVIDVYDVLNAYPSGCPPIDHAIKKLLCTGSRGAKDWATDLQEAIDSLERAKSFPPLPF